VVQVTTYAPLPKSCHHLNVGFDLVGEAPSHICKASPFNIYSNNLLLCLLALISFLNPSFKCCSFGHLLPSRAATPAQTSSALGSGVPTGIPV